MRLNELKEQDLETPGQVKMRDLVAQLPEETLSLAWRSELNEKLLATQTASRRKAPFAWLMKPATAFALAGALAAIVLVNTNLDQPSAAPVVTRSNGALEAALVRDHSNIIQISDVVGAGLIPDETTPTQTYSIESDWSDYDLDSL